MIDKRVRFSIDEIMVEGLVVDETDDFVFVHRENADYLWIPKTDIVEEL